MASASNAAKLCMLACRGAPRVQRLPRAQQLARQCAIAQRAFSTSPARWADGRPSKEGDDAEAEAHQKLDLKTMNKSFAETATTEGLRQLDELAKTNGYNTIDDFLESTLRETPGWASEDRTVEEELFKDDVGDKPNKSSFWFDEEDPETNTEEHDEFDEDDITSMAHGKLEEIREMRHYARLAVWEMPLLSKFAKPFAPPADDQVLRWRYTTYMGESHPAEKKVVVQFAPDDLKLTPVQTDKLRKLAGPRYNPETELVKVSCESYEHQAQNKRYLSNLVDDLIASAKDPKDTFADVPLDLRHHHIKAKPRFPKEWRLTNERRLQLDEDRQRAAITDIEKAEGGLLVDGKKAIDNFLIRKMVEEQEKQKVAELVAAPKAARSSGGASRAKR
ncbi:37S ribosomal protein S24, mitochondrial [Tolypocladium ophioglossoides CBS 100239]|uniref:37S ribosomal protein S24, mitochondrial n=1 Tax=Tolypocladium ophioglossoides (strain CBS 100239) TaxID=1163406 RepID=A0A0L0N6L0_TOLOC|nr:37S ribosomal protein S24, mitochondrial [Tolypocladium ophioglossoides CBS 100239]